MRAAYEAAIRAGYGDLADLFLACYPAKNIDESMLAATRDAMYVRSARNGGKVRIFRLIDLKVAFSALGL